ncbi:hypothetical protein M422DRAFT_49963 [Sphaerobolus stellatus SS14]|uniref:glycine dehydrogenase (aminomethyl-transferring) n=1 Tax=Sphaerobolus stellatus (strain SS14) TaxID=990650 RepID=A0A0C9UUA9_SPHS4|nr:hypothetical protein M422DRAFT_49963 [Sphaerobolus stellatus SS14]
MLSKVGRLAPRPRHFLLLSTSTRRSFFANAPAFKNAFFAPLDTFSDRHIGPNSDEASKMLATMGYTSMEDFVKDTVPPAIRVPSSKITDDAIAPLSESELFQKAKRVGSKNKIMRSYIGMGYHNAVVPPVILRNVMESPAWYTPYTPYQPEIAQGRLESLVNFQTMVKSLTGMDIANASLLDEATAAAEGMVMVFVASGSKKRTFFVDQSVSPQTIAVINTRCGGFGINLQIGDALSLSKTELEESGICGVLVQYPDVNGSVRDFTKLSETVHETGAFMIVATDLLALTMLKPPGEWGADVVLGSSARFGVPAGYGGPHAAFFATTDKLKRKMPGRLIGLSKDTMGNPAYRLALQTREQHIRREKATSNICTSQALLANMAAMYAVYHGPTGLKQIATRVHAFTQFLRNTLQDYGYSITNGPYYFDTLTIDVTPVVGDVEPVHILAEKMGINLRRINSGTVGVTLDESVGSKDLVDLINVFALAADKPSVTLSGLTAPTNFSPDIPQNLVRESGFLPHAVFNTHHSETEMLRYIYQLQEKDLSLCHAMIPLGSCTMKLNSTSSMIPLTWPEFSTIHPFVPIEQAQGYAEIIKVFKFIGV